MLVVDWWQRFARPHEPDAELDEARVRLLPDPAVPIERERLLHAMTSSAAVDGRISAGERRLLLAAADRYDVPRARVQAWIDEGGRGGQTEMSATGVEGPLLIRGLAAVALVDGKVDRKERALLRRMGAHAGLDAVAVDTLVQAEVRRRQRASASRRLRVG